MTCSEEKCQYISSKYNGTEADYDQTRNFNLTMENWNKMQVGGWTEVYGNILSFATVRGASHEVPYSQPERSLVLFKAFLEGQPLPELL